MSGELVVVGASDVRAIAARAGLFAVDFTALRSILAAQELLPASAWLSSSGLSFAASAAQAEVAFFGGAPLELQLSSLSQRILLALTQAGASREDSYRLVQRNAMKVWESDGQLQLFDLLVADPEVTALLPVARLEPLFDLGYHLKHVDTIFDRVFR